MPVCERCGATHPDPTPICASCAVDPVVEHAVHDAEGAESSRPPGTRADATFDATTTLPGAIGDLTGKTLLGQFHVLRKLGAGEFGAVYLAEQRGIDRPAVVKVLHRALAANPTAVKRFQREAKALARLDHHHLVKLYNFGELEDGTPFLAMEYGGERTLADVLRERRSLPPERVRHLGMQVCEALAEAHSRGVVHRDLKPANLLVSEKDGADWVKVVDVGIAKLLQAPGEETDVSTLTREGGIIGTPAYFSPEQARGQLELDGRSDLYSLGVVLYEAVSGRRPFRGATLVDLIRAHSMERPAPLRACGVDAPALEAVILRAMEKDPERRFRTALEMRDAIRLAERPRSRPRWPVVVAVGSIALAAFAFIRISRRAPVQTPAAVDAVAVTPTLQPKPPAAVGTTAQRGEMPAPPPSTNRPGTDLPRGPGRRLSKRVAKDKKPTSIGRCTEVVDSRPAPPAESGDGILVILATPWAQVAIDGNPIGEAPCEVRLPSGTYKMRLTNPELGEKDSTVDVAAGKRQVFQISLTR